MMPDLGKYADTVLSAYGASVVLIVLLVLVSLRRAAVVRRRLDAAEARRAALRASVQTGQHAGPGAGGEATAPASPAPSTPQRG